MATKPSFGQQLLGKAGKAIQVVARSPVGAAAKTFAPPAVKNVISKDYNLSEQAQRIGGYVVPKAHADTGVLSVQDQYNRDVSGLNALHQKAMNNYTNNQVTGGVYSGNTSGNYTPTTSGEPTGGGGDGGYDYIGALRSAFDQSRSALEGMLPTYDADYTNFKSLVEGGVNRAKETLGVQNAEDERLYGQDLKKLVQTDQELKQRRQGLFSGLNALDSSAYQNDVQESDQYLQERTGELDAEKRRTFNERQREYAGYEQNAMGQINAYSNEIARAKQGLQQAIASVNMDEASSIQNYISQLEAQSQQVQSNLQQFAMNLAQLQAQGTNVVGNLGKLNMGAFSNMFGQGLANRYNSLLSRYTPGQQGVQGSGFIGSSKNDEYLRSLGLIK